MKKVRSYTKIWGVEKVLYGINDVQLPFPVTFSQMAWFGVSFLIIAIFRNVPPLSYIPTLVKHVIIPVALAWGMSQKTFDGKKPFAFVRSVVLYLMRPKVTYAGKPIAMKKVPVDDLVTGVRREMYVPE